MSNNVEWVPITVAGNILSELSEKIPNNIIALNELIKNAYDACSPRVDITLESKSKNLLFETMVLVWIQRELRNYFIYQVAISSMGKLFLTKILSV
ncbi:putative uncharacterized protein [Streptococcus troglodytae]|uniref:Uncharacterized protein n=1 Tax=Streptococcus troglodytae TaxID=1111760 RepID=A0A1L7LGJ8_9STRE|nr:putative uncharacterized protein [Streptococcus troglodytae]